MGTYDMSPRVLDDIQYRLSDLERDVQRARLRMQRLVEELDTLTTALNSIETGLFLVEDVLSETRHRVQDLLDRFQSGGDTDG